MNSVKRKTFSWVPFYKELAKALLQYKENRKPLVEWIYDDLGKVKSVTGGSLVNYLKEEDGSKIRDIDPFSVFAIFNRASHAKRAELLSKFQEKFEIKENVPIDFDGIPTVDARRSFFFSWYDDKDYRNQLLWELFDKVVTGKNIRDTYNEVVDKCIPKYSLTMVLFWIAPERFLALDSRNRAYLSIYGYPDEYKDLNYDKYTEFLVSLQNKMDSGEIPFDSFPALSFEAWRLATSDLHVWMYSGNEQTLKQNVLRMGSSAQGKLDFSSYSKKEDLGKDYRTAVGNSDVEIPDMYWKFMREVKKGDVVAVFETRKENGKQFHIIYGWGKFTSECMFDNSNENPIFRSVEWISDSGNSPIDERMTKNALFFHCIKGIEAANIYKLLKINQDNKTEKMNNYQEYINLLRSNKNLILTGAPGTGKTFMTKEIAKAMGCSDEQIGFVQFHPNYDYTDFVEGLRPIDDKSGNVGFKRKDGVFKEFCKQALSLHGAQSPDSKFDMAYDRLCNDIKNRIVNTIPLRSGRNSSQLALSEGNTIKWYMPSGNSLSVNAVSKNRLAKLYEMYDSVDKLEAMDNVTDSIRDVIGGCDTTYYYAVLRNVLERIKNSHSVVSFDEAYDKLIDYLKTTMTPLTLDRPRSDSFKVSVNDKSNLTIDGTPIKKELIKSFYDKTNTNGWYKVHSERIIDYMREHYGLDKVKVNSEGIENIESPFVFIIDEINRGEISKIFGELFFSIDPGYRGEKGKVNTQYQNMIDEGDVFKNGFYVPENVYIIGTMNDIDRSVESMDFAMRRRFAWKEVTAEESMEMLKDETQDLKDRMKRLNDAILKVNGLGKAYQIGAAYFRKCKEYNYDYSKLWEFHLESLLAEYLRGSSNADKQLEELKKAYDNPTLKDDSANTNNGQ